MMLNRAVDFIVVLLFIESSMRLSVFFRQDSFGRIQNRSYLSCLSNSYTPLLCRRYCGQRQNAFLLSAF